ncbi:MaoC family dehydratase N-terminal domain-containing protein [uncultured Sneathiella sp.]|uniref:FAS1-like dehydratase domain-containing protein n=1 Tax=uncultured Sneathiella sp. TaxID=879315 RepID=UPI0030DBF637
MNELVSSEAKSWIGRSASPQRIEVNRSDIIKYAIATEQRAEKFMQGDVAPPMFLFAALRPLVSIDRLGSDGIAKDPFLPDLPLKRLMAGGTKMKYHRPVVPNDVLIATRTLSGITEKQGSSGPLLFLTYDLTVKTEAGELVMEEQQSRILR